MAQRGRGLADAARRAVGRAAKAVRGQDGDVTADGHAATEASDTVSPGATKKAPGKKSTPAKKSAKKTAPVKKTAPAKATTKQTSTKQTSTKRTNSGTRLTKKATTTNTRATAAQSKPTARTTSQRHKSPAASLQVGSNEEPWSEEELAAIRAELEHDLQTMLSELALSDEQIAELIEDASNASGDDPADTGSKAFEREHEMTLANNTRDLIRQTRRALGRIAAGSYGTCESCGNAIGKRRLQAFPRATLCVTCKQEQERR